MFKKTAAILRVAAIRSKTKAEQALARAQSQQVQSQKLSQLAEELEGREAVAALKKEALTCHLLHRKADSDYICAINELEGAKAVVEVARKRVNSTEELRQSASADYTAANARVCAMEKSLKKGCNNA